MSKRLSELRAEILTEFKQVHKLAPADYTENCTNVVMGLVKAWAAEEVIGRDKHSEYKKLDTDDEFIFGDQIIYDIENNLKAEQRKRLGLGNE